MSTPVSKVYAIILQHILIVLGCTYTMVVFVKCPTAGFDILEEQKL